MAVCESVAASPSNTACMTVPRTAMMKAAIIVLEWPGSRPCRAPSRIAVGTNSQACAVPCWSRSGSEVMGRLSLFQVGPHHLDQLGRALGTVGIRLVVRVHNVVADVIFHQFGGQAVDGPAHRGDQHQDVGAADLRL